MVKSERLGRGARAHRLGRLAARFFLGIFFISAFGCPITRAQHQAPHSDLTFFDPFWPRSDPSIAKWP